MRRSLLLSTVALIPVAALGSETVTYRYDALGRLSATSTSGGPNNGVSTGYQFDTAGNRTSASVTGVPAPTPSPTPTPTPTPGQVTIVDRSFEEPAVGSGFQYNPGVTGAFFDGGAGVAGNGSAWGFAAAPAGSQVGFLQSAGNKGAVIVLNVDGLVVGQRYAVRFKMAQRPGWAPDQVHVTLQNNSLGFFSPASTAFQDVITTAFTATSSAGALTFAGTANPNSQTVAIDDVSIVQSTAAGPGTIPNLSFEQPYVGASFQANPSVADQYFGGSSGVAGNGSAWGFGNAPQGTQAAYLQSSSAVVSMNVSNLTVGARYVVRFHMARRPGNPSNTLYVAFASNNLGLFTPSSTSFSPATTPSFTATSSTGVLSFSGQTGGDSGAGIDAITVEPAP